MLFGRPDMVGRKGPRLQTAQPYESLNGLFVLDFFESSIRKSGLVELAVGSNGFDAHKAAGTPSAQVSMFGGRARAFRPNPRRV